MKLLNGPTAAPRGRLAGISVAGLALVLVGLWLTDDGTGEADAQAGMTQDLVGTPSNLSPDTQGSVSASYAFARRAALKVTSNLFAVQSWYVPAPPPPPRSAAVVVPTAPPLPFAFLGSYARGTEKPVFFLTRGDVVYDVRAGDTIDRQWVPRSIAEGNAINGRSDTLGRHFRHFIN